MPGTCPPRAALGVLEPCRRSSSRRDEPRQRYLTEDEITHRWRPVPIRRMAHLATIVAVALNTGMRKAEILGLEWAHVTLNAFTLTLYKTKAPSPGRPLNGDRRRPSRRSSREGRRQGLLFKRRAAPRGGRSSTACEGPGARRHQGTSASTTSGTRSPATT